MKIEPVSSNPVLLSPFKCLTLRIPKPLTKTLTWTRSTQQVLYWHKEYDCPFKHNRSLDISIFTPIGTECRCVCRSDIAQHKFWLVAPWFTPSTGIAPQFYHSFIHSFTPSIMAHPIHVLDNNYLAITFLISLAIQLTAFLIAYSLQFDKLTDFSGGFNFLVIALVTLLLGQSFQTRNWLVSLAVIVWAIRLAGFLLFRVLKRGQDNRFDEMRSNFFKFGGFWTFQLIWVWIVSFPVIVLNSPNISGKPNHKPFESATDILGLIFFSSGFLIEALADVQKYTWKSKSKSNNKLPVCQTGFWKLSRHPNYFAEILLWWGIWFMVLASADNQLVEPSSKRLLRATVISPILITVLLLFLSGLPPSERPVQKNIFVQSYKSKLSKNINQAQEGAQEEDQWQQFQTYLDETSILIPIPKSIYRLIPSLIKKTLLLDWKIYRFDDKGPEAMTLMEEIRNESA
ncbi:hypothetical protein O181_055855 [Austropuccinia psidii MF-1]|uniref:Steroid 5-alpha reductase C-terminal domain-containing protein n=1 Tax=Austropuccinia psidii MF-1 TaxID=1389203 RepID=A0A9Q3EBM0_9BASI|nr:hypothetical protein [Austropuccinia psidii MF-1]